MLPCGCASCGPRLAGCLPVWRGRGYREVSRRPSTHQSQSRLQTDGPSSEREMSSGVAFGGSRDGLLALPRRSSGESQRAARSLPAKVAHFARLFWRATSSESVRWLMERFIIQLGACLVETGAHSRNCDSENHSAPPETSREPVESATRPPSRAPVSANRLFLWLFAYGPESGRSHTARSESAACSDAGS